MPKAAFPLSKNNSFKLGAGWDWCVFEVSNGATDFRLLVAYHRGKSEYLAWLGLVSGSDTALLARLEYHRSHLGWHVHMKPGDVVDVNLGVVKQPRERLVDCRYSAAPPDSKGSAVNAAFKIFKVSDKPVGGLLV